ncbi:MAG: RNA polymerase sigma factor RpoD/SigA [Lentisphaeria bacterium]|nr:RNA polymerase sigma factor RpoD/SigA [Lentisphaeria bacterium]NQZ69521.1 RNA polymerase sigma factor RpoD/SigA [Lentisphaeria bacterium]
MAVPDALKQYMHGIKEYPLITPEEEIFLADEIKAGDERALEKLISANLRLVVAIAQEFSNRGLGMEELVSEGNIGLIHAAKKFDPSKGAKFSTYAAWWIKQFMRRAISESDKVIRIPTSSLRKIRKIRKVKSEMEEKLGREPTDEEIARNSDYSENVVGKLKQAEMHMVSLQAPIVDGERDEVINLIPDESAVLPDKVLMQSDLAKHVLGRMLPTLNEREQHIINLRFGLAGNNTHTLEEISSQMGLTRERIRQLQKRALEKMRSVLDAEDAGNFGATRLN